MTITETLMDIGDWSIDLKPSTPGVILDRLADWYSCITVTKQRLSVADAKSVTRPLYRGVYHKRSGTGFTISGKGVEWYLGSPAAAGATGSVASVQTSGFGPLTGALGSVTLASLLATMVATFGGTYSTSMSGTMFAALSGPPRSGLDNIINAQLGAEWRLRPDLTLEVYDPTVITAPVAVIAEGTSGPEPDSPYVGWEIAKTAPTIDATDMRNRWSDNYNNSGGSGSIGNTASTAAPSDGYRTFAGTQLEVCGFGAYAGNDDAGAYAEAARQLTLHQLLTTGIDIDLVGYLPHTQLADPMGLVGAALYVHIPSLGLYDPATAPIQWHGALITPTKIRCIGIEWPLTQGVGVYLDNRHQGGDMVDITDSVVMESTGAAGSQTTKLHVGAMPRWWNGLRPVIPAR